MLPTRGEFLTAGQLDLARFLDLVHAEGMHAIVRPGPYICAEWTRRRPAALARR